MRNVTCKRGEFFVLYEQSFELPAGKSMVVTGANGVGKSTLLHLCAGIIAPDVGDVRLGGKLVDSLQPSRMVHAGIHRAFVFQQGGLVANLSALNNVGLALRYHADVLGLSEAVINERARFCLGAMGLSEPEIYALPGRLSFGIRKRVAFARAMALEPNFVFFDDPDAGLDKENAEVVHDVLRSFRDDANVTMVVATNHRLLIEKLALAPYELNEGRLIGHSLHDLPRHSLV